MKSNIYIPEKINVGYQNRSGTYTGKLAYVIYWDEKGKLRKENSWNSWRDSKIEPNDFKNEPTSGFVLNKKAGDYQSHWNHRQAYCRVYDPRNFEIEITIENLLYILENANSIKGKGLEGNFIYGWDGKDLMLMPCESYDYKEIKEYSNKIKNAKKFKMKDMIVGAKYLTKQNEEWIYMGRYDCHEEKYNYRNKKYDSKVTKKYFFCTMVKDTHWRKNNNVEYYNFTTISSLTNKIIECLEENPHTDYSFMADDLEYYHYYSPIDKSKDIKIYYEKDEFLKRFEWNGKYNNNITTYAEKDYANIGENSYRENTLYYEESTQKIYKKCYRKIKKSDYGYNWDRYRNEDYNEYLGSIDEFIQEYKPYYIKRHLKNGKFHEVIER